ncbi:MAG: hypothetical protein HGA47_03415 [Zoogloea sp.]|nr:hypothetical protein [Zoogloea sp.]
MAVHAHVRHDIGNRARIVIPEKRGQHAYLEQARQALSAAPGIDEVEANPLTGSLLVTHHTDIATIARLADDLDLFSIVEDTVVTVRAKIRQRLARLSGDLRSLTGGSVDLGDLTFLILIGIALREAARGHFVQPPVATLIWYAITALSFPEALQKNSPQFDEMESLGEDAD